MPTQHNLVIEQGSTFVQVVRWETLPLQYAAISAITQAAPAVVTSANHGIPDGWQVAIVSVKGMTEINAAHMPPRSSEWHRAYVSDNSTVSFPDINAAGFSPYVSGGYIMYYTPIGLSGYSARMKIKDKIGGTTLDSFTSDDALAIDTAAHAITLTISAASTAAYEWTKGVYDLELVSSDGTVTAILNGTVAVLPEVTTDN